MTDALETTAGSTTLALILGDITLLHVDAIVNAANSGLRGGGGVDGAIHRAGGPQILEECRTIVAAQGPCPTGQAVITSGGQLKARRVIHAVGPIWHGGAAEEDRLLADAYRNSLALARRHGLKTVAFPSISTGVYGFPIERAASIAYSTVCTVVEREPWFTRVVFVAYTDSDFEVYARLFVTETPRTT